MVLMIIFILHLLTTIKTNGFYNFKHKNFIMTKYLLYRLLEVMELSQYYRHVIALDNLTFNLTGTFLHTAGGIIIRTKVVEG